MFSSTFSTLALLAISLPLFSLPAFGFPAGISSDIATTNTFPSSSSFVDPCKFQLPRPAFCAQGKHNPGLVALPDGTTAAVNYRRAEDVLRRTPFVDPCRSFDPAHRPTFCFTGNSGIITLPPDGVLNFRSEDSMKRSEVLNARAPFTPFHGLPLPCSLFDPVNPPPGCPKNPNRIPLTAIFKPTPTPVTPQLTSVVPQPTPSVIPAPSASAGPLTGIVVGAHDLDARMNKREDLLLQILKRILESEN